MLNKLFSIAKNTFTETIRQPIYAVILIIALLAIFISPSLTMYTLDNDNKLLRELGLSTLFLAGLFIAIFSASAAVTEEFETKTIITILSKPIRRPIFIIGKFLGVSAAVFLAYYICTIAFLMATRHGVLSTASDSHDMTVLTAGGVIIVVSILLTAFLNYSYDWKFSSTAIVSLAVLATLGIIFLSLIDRNWKFNPANNKIAIFDIYAAILVLIAVIVLVAVAIMFSTRFNVVLTLICCVSVFLLGLISDYVFGRFAETHIWAKIGRMLVPNLQVFWISDAIYEQSSQINLSYIITSASYGLCYAAAMLLIAIALFQSRQAS